MNIAMNYLPQKGGLWDHWVYREKNGLYHLYYLYDERENHSSTKPAWLVGHATSRDLSVWTEHSPALRPAPEKGLHAIATGSVIEFGERYAMLVTDHAHGICLAWSDDLYTWEAADGNPVLPITDERYENRETIASNPPGCGAWADPYLFRKPGSDDVFLILNTRLREGDILSRGCVALFRSADMVHWKSLGPLLVPGISKRCETPQIFTKNGRWYLICSIANELLTDEFRQTNGVECINAAAFVWTADRFEGPYELRGKWKMLEDKDCYICKVIEAPEGGDVVLSINCHAVGYPPRHGETGITRPFQVTYPLSGGIGVETDV